MESLQEELCSEALRIANLAFKADKRILGVAVLDEHGRILAGAPLEELKRFEDEMGEELLQMGAAAAVVLATGEKAAKYLGTLRYLNYGFEGRQILAFSIHRHGMALVVALEREAQVISIYKELSALFLA
jgi:hypothetical protein